MGLPLGSVVMERGYGPRGTLSNSWGPCLVLGAAPGVVMTGGKAGRLGEGSGTFHSHTEQDTEGTPTTLPLTL